ncbi:putative Ubiquitin-conjugating enzyme E2 2 [Babesia bovis T2Bo]|uniref:Ubiquitin-conjugating enzyme, putative n=1 Tax=Babesia bovis TaxID=5865 RepID=A7AU10_BABBO|nr:putative Ubiquitin-conjugating enzyme E2 2 [Babesia bovis T2Bo]EDO06421.1 putative Ubiquitin-conjugating enzyme E2 2 [Babesia bovis T2Bo]BAN65127.1 ubiquitin-conjugating enzyme, putative [Babesia bovis]|eukprot:XP_001609989.1 ubiquitin-conjugating enzyme [Babesia bovis T2Bo]
MSTFARRRIVQDISKITKDPPEGCRAEPFPDNMMVCHAIIRGPKDTLWETGTFHLLMKFTEEYPTKPPCVKFISKIYHPNVYLDGRICLDILQNQWTAIYDISSILLSIQSLLSEPNIKSPANSEAAKKLETDKIAYDKNVLKCVEDSWIPPRITKATLKF